jgi:DNA-directed RNA polymerase subunit H (RpoH/RPB5)
MRKFWTPEEYELLKKHFPHVHTKDVAAMLNRSYESVSNQAYLFGLKKSAEFMASEKSGRKNVLMESGKAFRFPKGHTSWNKGKEFPRIGRMEEGQFKKGNLPHNTKYDGAERLQKDKTGKIYKYIRLSKSKWKMVHVVEWEKANGIVPKGMVIVFKDGNTLNTELSNLEMISRADLMRRNTIQRFPKELVEVIKLKSKLIKTIKRHGKESTT